MTFRRIDLLIFFRKKNKLIQVNSFTQMLFQSKTEIGEPGGKKAPFFFLIFREGAVQKDGEVTAFINQCSPMHPAFPPAVVSGRGTKSKKDGQHNSEETK